MVHRRPRKRDEDAGTRSRRSDGDVQGGTRSALCAGVGAHIAHVQAQLNALEGLSPADNEIRAKASSQLDAARAEIEGRGWHRGLWRRLTRTDVVAALCNVHEAEVELTRLLKDEELKGRVPQILTEARAHLPSDDPQLNRLEKEWGHAREGRLPAEAKSVAVDALHAAHMAQELERIRVRSFTQILICSIVIMSLIAVGFGLWATADPDVADLFCFTDRQRALTRICPIGGYRAAGSDVFLIEFMGMFAAALAGAASLSTMRGNSSPYQVSMLLLLLRLPAGAMTAVLGILLVSGAFFPGLTSLDASAQIIAWAAAFGILQEPVTRAVDKTGRSFLEELTPAEGDKERSRARPSPSPSRTSPSSSPPSPPPASSRPFRRSRKRQE